MVKPYFESVNVQKTNSFTVRVFEEKAFASPYHYHPEFELTLITKGSGKRYVGNHMGHFSKGDLFFLAPNLPHCWKTEPSRGVNACSIVVQFAGDFMGIDFFNKPELSVIHRLMERSQSGLVYKPSFVPEIIEDMKKLSKEQSGFKKLHLLLDVLHKLSVANEFTLLTSSNPLPAQISSDLERINRVFKYISDNYKTNFSLDKVAEHACMTPNAFCKYFKKVTHKTFREVVIDYRLNFATNQLIHTNNPVAQICFDCGFNDVAHFIRTFKSKMDMPPLKYRKKFSEIFRTETDYIAAKT